MTSTTGRPLSVALLNATDYAGGAESVVRMLRDGLRCRGHEAVLWVGRQRSKDNAEHTRRLPGKAFQRRAAKRYAEKGFFNIGLPASLSFCQSTALSGVDLVHLHNLHGHYFSITAVPRLTERAPLVWTFHDFFPITGGCVFPYNCDRWMSRCGSCPQQGQYPIATEFDRTRRMQSIKRQAFRDLPVTIVTPSRHLNGAVKRSGVFTAADVHIIPYGVDTHVFQPGRREARMHLGLSPDRPVVLLAAQGLDDPRKGIEHAVTALRQVSVPGLAVLLVGSGDVEPVVQTLLMHEVRALGYLTNRTEVARCYAAADLFIFTSLAENFPCVVQEAMACGTAVLAFDIDGVNEQITHDRTGFLVPTGDTDRLTRAAGQLLRNTAGLAEIGSAAGRHAQAHWTLEAFLDHHERLYRDILDRTDRLSRAKSKGMQSGSPHVC